jgi:hypothetical protein
MADADRDLVDQIRPPARWVIPVGFLCAFIATFLIGLGGAVLMAMATVIVYAAARVLSLSDRATTIALVVGLGVSFVGGFGATMWLTDLAAEEARRVEEAEFEAAMQQSTDEAIEASREDIERAAQDAFEEIQAERAEEEEVEAERAEGEEDESQLPNKGPTGS